MPPSPSPPPTPALPAVVPAPAPGPAITILSPPTSSTRPGTRPHQHRRLSSTYLASLVSPTKEEFDHIAEIQSQREADLRRRSREMRRLSDTPTTTTHNSEETAAHGHHHSSSRGSRFLDRLGLGHLRRISGTTTSEEAKAATVIQRNYRGYRARREMRGMGLDASTRWVHAVREAQWRAMTQPRGRNEDAGEEEVVVSPGRRQWRKVATIARRAGEDASSGGSSSMEEEEEEDGKRREEARERRRKKARMMGLQYFLEMVDLKHRYGANLRVYHEEWKRADTNENFFYWLDHGEGRTLDIEACPRERLEWEQVRYLSREERQYYLVTVDEEGRLCWAKNGAKIDTTEKWKDSVHGIVPADDTSTPEFRPPAGDSGTRLLGDSSTDSDSSSSSSSSDSSTDSETAAEAAHYATPSLDTAKGVKKIKHVTVATLFDKLLRKSVRRNTWIFVVDTSFRLYVGIKNSGAFQHSSFLQGSRISAAGLIKIRDGKLTSLSPLSGHYRPPASNFRAFLKSLREEGVDMKHVTISKSYAVLVGLETYVKIHKKGKEVMGKLKRTKERVVAPEEYKRHEEERKDKSESAAREEQVMRQEEQMREENQVSVKAMQKLGLEPREPKGQRGAEEVNAGGASV